mmetsp:Transcript_40941/g.103122  ORF Transcript_40941/g.103122 Transcript_40941/m.103122 type:complete len:208 (+) Transcript_40941:420-1043(+)
MFVLFVCVWSTQVVLFVFKGLHRIHLMAIHSYNCRGDCASVGARAEAQQPCALSSLAPAGDGGESPAPVRASITAAWNHQVTRGAKGTHQLKIQTAAWNGDLQRDCHLLDGDIVFKSELKVEGFALSELAVLEVSQRKREHLGSGHEFPSLGGLQKLGQNHATKAICVTERETSLRALAITGQNWGRAVHNHTLYISPGQIRASLKD